MRCWWVFFNSVGVVLIVAWVVVAVLLGCGWRFCVVQSSSMVPSIDVGDLVVFRASAVSVGDVVVFENCGKLIAHRVDAMLPTSLIVSGESEHSTTQKISRSNIVGKMLFCCSFDGLILGVFLIAICVGVMVVITAKVVHFGAKNAKKSHF